MYRLICQKPAHFVCPSGFSEHFFFQKFIVLGMYNFANRPSLQYLDVVGCKQLCQKTTLKNMAEELLGGGLDIDGKAFESDQIIT